MFSFRGWQYTIKIISGKDFFQTALSAQMPPETPYNPTFPYSSRS